MLINFSKINCYVGDFKVKMRTEAMIVLRIVIDAVKFDEVAAMNLRILIPGSCTTSYYNFICYTQSLSRR